MSDIPVQAVRHRLSCIFRAWAEATRAEEDRLDDLTEDVRHATEHARILRDEGATREMRTDAEAQRRAAEHRLAGAMVARRPDPGADYMDDERAPKRGHSSPAGGAAAAGPSTPTRTAGGSPSASGTPPPNQPKRPRNRPAGQPPALPPSIADGEGQALREASEILAAKAGDGPPARRA